MAKRGKLLVISGPSGVGKSTLIAGIRAKYPDMYFSISATSRQMREGDADGVTYWFKTREEFLKMVEDDLFYEHAEYSGNLYGTPREPVESRIEQGIDIIMDIDVQGAFQIQQKCPDAVLVFVVAPKFSMIEERLKGRGDTKPEDMEKRLNQARWEYSQACRYDYIVVNAAVDTAVDDIDAILRSEKLKADRFAGLNMMEELL